MSTYISFLNFTEQGIETTKDLPSRIPAGRQAMEANLRKRLEMVLELCQPTNNYYIN